MILPYFRVERFELPAYARQVQVHGFGIDMTGEEDNVKGQSVWCGLNRKVMQVTKCEIRVKG